MNLHLYDFRWNSPTHMELQATDGRRFGRREVTFGEKLSISVAGEVACAGSVRDGEWSPCPEQVTGRHKCPTCRAREGNFIFHSFDGFDTSGYTDADMERIRGTHYVYLALFDRELLKVGVCREDRRVLRQLEQGSHMTAFIAKTPDGIIARQIETLLRQSGMSDRIRPSQKKEFLTPDMTPEDAAKIVEEKLTQIRSTLSTQEHLLEHFFSHPELEDWGEQYHLARLIGNEKPFHSLALGVGESVSGHIITVKGGFVVLDTGQEVVCLCMKDLLGRHIDFSERPEGLEIKAALQGAMF